MTWALTGLGLVFALLPGRLDQLLAAIATLSREQRRLIGLFAVAAGVVLIWLVRG
jgi:uncharacterized protein YjeT (DUF2065 family)